MNRRAKSSDTLKPLPVSAMNAVLFRPTICVRPSGRTRAGRSVSTEASVSDRSVVPLTLSRNRIGEASINSDASRLSSSWRSPPLVKARGCTAKAMAEIERTSRPFPVPAPEISGALTDKWGASHRLVGK